MTNEERDKLINSILPDTVKGQQRPAENLNPDMPYSTDFPQLINKDPASADVFNLINRQLLSNDKSLNDNKADKTYVDKKVADLVNGAPEQLDTLQELSKALNNDKDYATTVNNALAEKLGKTEKAESAEVANYAKAADMANNLRGYPLATPGGDNPFGKVPVVSTDGVLEIGKCIDFHSKNGDKKDYTARITVNDDGTLSFSGSIKTNLTGTASSAGSVPWAGVTGKPSTYPPSAHTHGLINSDFTALVGGDEDDTWGAIGINAAGHVLKSIRVNKVAPDWLLANYSAGIAFGGEDTRGVISASYDAPKVKFAGGNGNKPVWYYSLLGSSGKEYNLDNYLPLIGGAMTGPIAGTPTKGLSLMSNSDSDDGAYIGLFDSSRTAVNDRGQFVIRAATKDSSGTTRAYSLIGRPDGILKWGNTDLAGAGIVSQQLGQEMNYIKYANGLLVQFGTMHVQGYAGAKDYVKTLPLSYKQIYSKQATLGYPSAREVSSVQIESDLTMVKLWIYNFVSSSAAVTTFEANWLMIGSWK